MLLDPIHDHRVAAFVQESNAIEGIFRDPTLAEVSATGTFLSYPATFTSLVALQAVYAPGKPIRDRFGMNVRVGTYVAPGGGRNIEIELRKLVDSVRRPTRSPWRTHCRFERLHPFLDGNGRSGRALWARHMLNLREDPFAIPFLQRFYYQTLGEAGL